MFVSISHEKFVVVSYLQGGSEKCFFSMNWQDIVAILFWSRFHFIFSLLPCIWATFCSLYFYKDFSVKVADLLTISSTAAWSKPSLCWHEHSPCQPLCKPNTQGQSLNFDKKISKFYTWTLCWHLRQNNKWSQDSSKDIKSLCGMALQMLHTHKCWEVSAVQLVENTWQLMVPCV